SPGVDFNQINPSVTVPFQPGITPIVVSVSVPNKNTNVDKITVIIKEPSGTILVNQVSPTGTNKVDTFPITPLPEKSTMTVTFGTKNGQPPENVTLSIIACYTPSTATTIVTSSKVPPSVSGSTPALTISSTSTGVTQGTVHIYKSHVDGNAQEVEIEFRKPPPSLEGSAGLLIRPSSESFGGGFY
ncbi:unnamed protein product, partial [Rotaria sp. Silwood1]